jgi:hypothetical protein
VALADDAPIWYASYGSNCLAARFDAYLQGGQAEGATRGERGARDPRPPTRTDGYWFSRTVRFLGDSAKWGGGGVAFLDHEEGGRAPGRIYLVTKGQFDDVVAQESGRALESVPVADLVPGVVTPLGAGYYDGLLRLADIDTIPVVTFTSPRPVDARPTTPPSAAYLGTILRGLLEVHGDDRAAIIASLLDSPGVAAGWTAQTLEALVGK